MPKYSCDFNQVSILSNKLIASSSDLTKSTKSYLSEIERELSNWTGASKDFFIEQTRIQTRHSLLKAHSYNCLGEYINAFAQKIENLEESLANNRI